MRGGDAGDDVTTGGAGTGLGSTGATTTAGGAAGGIASAAGAGVSVRPPGDWLGVVGGATAGVGRVSTTTAAGDADILAPLAMAAALRFSAAEESAVSSGVGGRCAGDAVDGSGSSRISTRLQIVPPKAKMRISNPMTSRRLMGNEPRR